MPQIEEIIRKSFHAYLTQDRALIESVIGDPFSFSSPLDDHIDRATYFARCWPNSDKFRAITVEKIFAEGDEAFVQYVGETTDGKRFRNVERHRVANGKLVEVDVYFGRTLAG